MSSFAARFRYLECGRFSGTAIVRRSMSVNSEATTHRRSFLGRMFGAAAAAGLSLSGTRLAAAPESATDDWTKEVKGTHRCLFDFTQHKNGFPAAAHPELLEHLRDGLQGRPGPGRRRRDVL
jgi:hypothetical protein